MNVCIPSIRVAAQPVQILSRHFEEESVERICLLMTKFDGQQVPGAIFGVEGTVELPKFADVQRPVDVDIRSQSQDHEWLVEIKTRFPTEMARRVRELRVHGKARSGKTPQRWFIVMSDIPAHAKQVFAKPDMFISSLEDIVQLEQIVSAS